VAGKMRDYQKKAWHIPGPTVRQPANCASLKYTNSAVADKPRDAFVQYAVA